MSEEYLRTEVKAIARYVRVSPQKARLVVDQIREKDVVAALDALQFMPQAAAGPVFKLVRSAVANAEENFGLSRDDLYISRIYVDGAPLRKWRRFGARGRFKPILRRSSHITVVLEEYEYE
ncbi:MAG: 50S ribosomal protein L22 [Anaerolineae bacterium]|jgi:large subunit ribosomal protein L22|nr:50S ribosomal protein L22 [Anaerolineae bacterium]